MSTKKLDANAVAQLVANASKGLLADHLSLELITRIRDLLPDEEEKEEKPPATKKQFVVLVSDPAHTLPEDFALACWAMQIPEDEAPQTVESKIVEAAREFNDTKKGRLVPVQTIGEAVESVPAKIAKAHGVWFKNRVPTYALVTRNEIPNTPGLFAEEIDPKRKEALGGFVKLCKDSGATMEIRTHVGTVKIDGDGVSAATAAKIGGAE